MNWRHAEQFAVQQTGVTSDKSTSHPKSSSRKANLIIATRIITKPGDLMVTPRRVARMTQP
jgi:hypothetical protein